MKKFKIILLIIVLLGVFALPATPVSAQDYAFTVTSMEVEAYIEEDGTLSLWYLFEFQNLPSGAPIEYVDIGMPSSSYSRSAVQAEVDGVIIEKVESSPYVPNGFALNLEDKAIQPGQSGTVTAWITGVEDVVTPYDNGDRENYANFQFSPNWFDSQYDKSSNTAYRLTIILPPGVGSEEGVYYYPSNWPGDDTPDDIGRTAAEDRAYYSWYAANADAHTQYTFGVAFPDQYIPEKTVVQTIPVNDTPSSSGGSNGILAALSGNVCCFGFGLLFVAIFGWSIYQGTVGAKKRKMKYLPPKMKIEGHGIKRGLTAVEAAILMEQPMDKVMTMILFGALKKEAAIVEQSDPLKLTVTDPLPEGLHQYETDFLNAFKESDAKRRTALQKMMVDLVNSVSQKMKGFSRKETIAYYEDIMRRAWKMVEESQTPEVKSENYDQTLEWTMLDDDYAEHTRRTFSGGPVFVPMWWPRYSPTYRRNIGRISPATPASGGNVSTSGRSSSSGSPSLPHIPGSDFAAGVVNGVTGMAAGVVGNLTSFTNGITTRTNPIPVSSKSGSGGFRGGGGSSGGCACACACAGCACACAGGGR